MFRFENIDYLYGLLAIPLLIIVYVLVRRWKKRALFGFLDANLISSIIPDDSKSKPLIKMVLMCFAILFLTIGIANPQIGSKLEEIKREGVDIIIALDVSNSMKAEDLYPNRLEKAKQAISKLVDNLKDDRIGIVVFAGQAYVQLPVTSDYAAAKLFLNSIDTDIIPTQGTAIGTAIELSMNSFDKNSKTAKSIIVITDGENHEDDAIKMAEFAAEKKITVHTIGMGSEKGAPIPLFVNGKLNGYRKDKESNTIITKINESLLQDVASAAKGVYVQASNSQDALNIIFDKINNMQKTEFGNKVYSDYEDRFQYFIAAAILFLLIELLLNNRKSKFWNKLNLFGENYV